MKKIGDQLITALIIVVAIIIFIILPFLIQRSANESEQTTYKTTYNQPSIILSPEQTIPPHNFFPPEPTPL